jgi:TRAP-type C4-dicarboxylate transport system substrate-binding protein
MQRIFAIFAALAVALGFAAPVRADETRLIFTTISPAGSTTSDQIWHPWADRVNAAGKGVVHIDVRDGFALASSANYYDRLLGNVMQISFGSLNYIAGKFQLSQVMALPFLMSSAEQESEVFWRLYKSGLLDSEFDQIVPLFFYAFPQQAMNLVKTPAKPLEDLSNLKIIASGQIGTTLMSKLGAAPLSIPLTDTYEALQRGTADGLNFPISALPDFKLDEATHYHIIAALGGGPGGVWMAKATYDALSPQIRKILDDNSGEAQTRRVGEFVDQLTTTVQKKLESDPSQRVVTLRPDLQRKWIERAEPMIDAWANIDDTHRKVVEAVRKYAAEFAAGK